MAGNTIKTQLILVRHAQAEGNLLREFHGWTDSEITETGHKQAHLAAQKLKGLKIDKLYSSSMKRAIQTAEYISMAKQLPIIRTDKLKEINGGDWEKVRFDLLSSKWPKEHDTWENKPHLHVMPNGESMKEFQSRLLKEIKFIINENMGKHICIVTHGTAIKAMICSFRGFDLSEMAAIPWVDNTSVSIVEYENDSYRIISEGDADHLGSELSTLQNQDWWPEYLKKVEARKSALNNN